MSRLKGAVWTISSANIGIVQSCGGVQSPPAERSLCCLHRYGTLIFVPPHPRTVVPCVMCHA